MRMRWLWTLPLAVAATIVWLSSQSHYPGGLQLPPPLDKVAHLSVFATLAWALDLALQQNRPGLPLYRRHLLVFLAVSCFGATDEWHQHFTPGRACELGDWLADSMTIPFLLRGMGFTKMQIGTVQKTTAMVAIIIGGLIGGWLLTRISLRKALWICAFVQMGSILGFWAISMLGRHLPLLVAANTLENLAFGMGGSAFAALLMGSCNRSYTGTQYALFSALMALPRSIFSGLTGFMADWYGWKLYFPICAAAAIPGMLLLLMYSRWGLPEGEDLGLPIDQ